MSFSDLDILPEYCNIVIIWNCKLFDEYNFNYKSKIKSLRLFNCKFNNLDGIPPNIKEVILDKDTILRNVENLKKNKEKYKKLNIRFTNI